MTVISADSLLLSHIKETVPGQTPATPAFEVWRTTGESLVFSPNTVEATELGGTGRTRNPADVTGTTVQGDINFNLAEFNALDEAIAGVLASDWGECPLTGAPGGAIDDTDRITVGNSLPTFTIEKRFPNPTYVTGAMPITAVLADETTATATVTFANGPTVGSGVVILEIAYDNGPSEVFNLTINPGDTDDAVATAFAALINSRSSEINAADAAGVVTLTLATATSFTSGTVRIGADEYVYQRYIGCSYSVLNLTTAPNERVTGNVTVIGGLPVLDYLPITGATYNDAGSDANFTAPEVLGINIGAILGVGTSCFSSLTINLDSQNRGIPCIGSSGDREVVTGLLAPVINGDVYFSSQEPLEYLLRNEVVGDGDIVFSNATGKIYRFDFPGLKVTSGELAAGGTGEDLIVPLEFQPTPQNVCDDGGGNNWTSGLIISKKNTAPTWP